MRPATSHSRTTYPLSEANRDVDHEGAHTGGEGGRYAIQSPLITAKTGENRWPTSRRIH